MKRHGAAATTSNARIHTVINIISENTVVYTKITAIKFRGNRTAFIACSEAGILFYRYMIDFNRSGVVPAYINGCSSIVRFVIVNLCV